MWLAFLLSVCKTCISYSRAGWVVSFILIFHTLCPAHMIVQYTCFVDSTPFDFNKKYYVTKPHTCIQNRFLYMLNREKSRLNNAKQTHFGKLKYWQFKRICFIIYKISEKITLKNLKTTFKKNSFPNGVPSKANPSNITVVDQMTFLSCDRMNYLSDKNLV